MSRRLRASTTTAIPCPTRLALALALANTKALALAMVVFGAGCGTALAQDAATATGPSTSRFVPSVSVSETYLRSSGAVDGAGQGEFITRVSPGLSWTSRAGRVQGSVNYVVDFSTYSRRGNQADINNTLAANVRATLIEQRAFVDVQANVGQSAISAFGQQSGNDTFQANPNRSEFSSVQISPYVVGSLGGLADYSLRLVGAANSARSFSASNTSSWSALGSLRSPASGARVGWGLSVQKSESGFQSGRSISNERVTGEVNVRPISDLQLFATVGQERTNALDIDGRSSNSWGGGLRWTPSVRTNVALESDKRYFGDSRRVLVEYRSPQTVWRYLNSQDSSNNAALTASTPVFTLYQLYFEQFASTVPDPIAREIAVRDFLRQIGRDPNEVVGGGSLISALSLQRRQELSAAWVGRRTTINLQAFGLNVRQLDAAGATQPILDQSRVRQTGLTASISYRLTPQTSVTASGSRQLTATSGLRAGNSLNTVALGVSTQFSRRVSLGFNARYADFNSATDPYRQALATATLNFRF